MLIEPYFFDSTHCMTGSTLVRRLRARCRAWSRGASPPRNVRGRRDVRRSWYVANVSSEVDVTLIQETLALTPQQRIQQNDRVLRMIEELRDGFAKSRKPVDNAGLERR